MTANKTHFGVSIVSLSASARLLIVHLKKSTSNNLIFFPSYVTTSLKKFKILIN